MKTITTLLLTTALGGTAFAQALQVAPNGNVGIRTSTPRTALDVVGEIVAQNRLTLAYTSGTTTPTWHLDNDYDMFRLFRQPSIYSPGTVYLNITNQGNVGIGTTSPQQRLHVAGRIKSDQFELDSDQSTPNSFLTISTGGYVDFQSPGFDVISFGPNPALLSGASWEHFKIFRDVGGNVGLQTTGTSTFAVSGGNVGVGINNPDRKLRVLGNAAFGNTAQDYHAQAGNWNYTVILDGSENTSIGFHDAGHSVSSIRYNGHGFTIGGNDGWGVKNVYMPASVGIGTLNATHTLTVNGQVKSRGFVTDNSNWADYVFKPEYALAPLSDIEAHIKEKGHLPGIPSEAEVKAAGGVEIGDMQVRLLSKVEELTLHLIAMEKQIKAQQALIEQLRAGSQPANSR